MKTPFGFVALASAVALLAGCNETGYGAEDADDPVPPSELGETDTTDPEPDPVPEVQPADDEDGPVSTASATSKAEIDWDAARRDLASSPERDGDGSFSIQSGSSAPPVPVLLPTGRVRTASAPDGAQPQFRPVSDGYFAVFPGQDYNLIVNGTNEVTDAPSLENRDTGEMKYSETTTGSIVSFSRYGADYMIEFECLGSGEEGNSCVTEAEALSVAEEIVISGTQ